MSREWNVRCGPADKKDGKRVVIFSVGTKSHRERINSDDAWQRKQARERAIAELLGDDDPEVHAQFEAAIVTAADTEDARTDGDSLWTPQTINLADVVEKPVRWFWQHYIPEGAITLIDGDPNEGKSTIAIDIAARYTRGDAMPPHTAPNNTCDSGNVLLMSGEDDLQRRIKPQLRTAGASVERVEFLRIASIDGEDERIIQLPGDMPIIERVIVEKKIGFVVVDVLSCFTQQGESMNDEGAMRRLATRFADMLERTRATALVLRHLNKKENLRGMYRGGGSIAIVAAARAGFAIAPHPDEPDVKVLAPIKHNFGPRPPSLTYTIEAAGDTSRIRWGGQTDLTAADVLHPAKREGGGSKVETAKSIIADVLASGPRGSNEVETACTQAGLSTATYWRARQALRIQAEKTDFDGQWLLSMPSTNGHVDNDF